MNKPTYSLLIAAIASALISIAPITDVQAQLNDGVPSDPGLFGTVYNFPADADPTGHFGDVTGATLTQINFNAGSAIGGNGRDYNYVEANLYAGSELNYGQDFFNSEVNLISGTILGTVDIDANSTLNMSGGFIGTSSNVFGTAHISAGVVSQHMDAEDGSVFTITGGDLGSNFDAKAGSVVNISGASTMFGTLWEFESGSNVTVSGGMFSLNGKISGTASVNISGGSFGTNLIVTSNDLAIAGGDFSQVLAKNGSVVNIGGGDFGANFSAESGSEVVVNGGSFGNGFNPNAGSVVTITGGEFDDFFTNDGTTSISGGTFDASHIFRSSGDTNFTGTAFFIDGVPIAGSGLQPITDRGGAKLTGILQDGSSIDVDLFATGIQVDERDTRDFFSGGLTVTIVPEPGSLALLGLSGLALAVVRRR
ncbi:PEP-CTERM sorting domain-containing protein [Adhaeretor mobilis]|uniref:Ice-binding protein C-terminal domain-containing protein n=1 Tax=Adhaeretor mobilis TaxID=1930276 RepID=A0A517MWM8_9BACT|nr:PEP-CTERM sorting domain-containing protein [Adhaeretor mobilis]QDS99281.1 hypothetical protein HG15A2_26030 [Adhaeretor mobilis]